MPTGVPSGAEVIAIIRTGDGAPDDGTEGLNLWLDVDCDNATTPAPAAPLAVASKIPAAPPPFPLPCWATCGIAGCPYKTKWGPHQVSEKTVACVWEHKSENTGAIKSGKTGATRAAARSQALLPTRSSNT